MILNIINLKRSKNRWNKIHSRLLDIGIGDKDIQRIDAIDGRRLNKDQLKEFSPNIFRTKSQIGCFLSHRKAWQTVYDSKQPALILEDDAFLVDDFIQKWNDEILQKNICDSKADFIYIGCFGACSYDRKYGFWSQMIRLTTPGIVSNDDLTYEKIFVPEAPAGFHCYFLTPKGAQVLLNEMKEINDHVDIQFHSVSKNLKVFALKEPLAFQFSTNDNSTLSTSNFPRIFNYYFDNQKDENGIASSYYIGSPLISLCGQEINLYKIFFFILSSLFYRFSLILSLVFILTDLFFEDGKVQKESRILFFNSIIAIGFLFIKKRF